MHDGSAPSSFWCVTLSWLGQTHKKCKEYALKCVETKKTTLVRKSLHVLSLALAAFSRCIKKHMGVHLLSFTKTPRIVMAAINKTTKGLNQLNTQKQPHCGAETCQKKERKESKSFCLTAVLNLEEFQRTENLMFLRCYDSSCLCLLLFKHLSA